MDDRRLEVLVAERLCGALEGIEDQLRRIGGILEAIYEQTQEARQGEAVHDPGSDLPG